MRRRGEQAKGKKGSSALNNSQKEEKRLRFLLGALGAMTKSHVTTPSFSCFAPHEQSLEKERSTS
jgi:hypothetical protein